MHVTFHSALDERVLGVLHIDPDSGRALAMEDGFDPRPLEVVEPGDPPTRVYPKEGERYLEACVRYFRSPYLYALLHR